MPSGVEHKTKEDAVRALQTPDRRLDAFGR